METFELKPCPFCGGKANYIETSTSSGNGVVGIHFFIECARCKASLKPTNGYMEATLLKNGELKIIDDARGRAADAWNERSGEEIENG